MNYWHIHNLRIGTNERGAIMVAPDEFWANWPQWRQEGLISLGRCDPDPYDSPDLLITDKFRSGAVPEEFEARFRQSAPECKAPYPIYVTDAVQEVSFLKSEIRLAEAEL